MKKKIFILSLTLLFALSSVVFATKNSDATDITKNVSIKGDILVDEVTDNDLTTFCDIKKSTKIEISSSKKISSINFVFDTPPKKWTITQQNGEEIPCGRYQFLHELVKLDSEQEKITVEFNDAKLSEIQFFTQGALPSSIQNWSPPHYNSDLLLICDDIGDEFKSFGSIVPLISKEKKIQIAYMKNPFENSNSKTQHDLLNALWNSGQKTYPSFFETTAETDQENAILDYQTKILRQFKPNVVVSETENSPYATSLKMALKQSIDPKNFQQSALEYGVYSPEKVYQLSSPNQSSVTKLDFTSTSDIAQKSYDFYGLGGKIDWDKTNSYSLLSSTLGEDTYKNDLFENVILDKTENIRLPVENEKTNPDQQKALEKLEKAKKEKKKIIGNSLIVSGVLILIFSVSHKNRRKKRNLASKPLTHQSMRNKFIQ